MRAMSLERRRRDNNNKHGGPPKPHEEFHSLPLETCSDSLTAEQKVFFLGHIENSPPKKKKSFKHQMCDE